MPCMTARDGTAWQAHLACLHRCPLQLGLLPHLQRDPLHQFLDAYLNGTGSLREHNRRAVRGGVGGSGVGRRRHGRPTVLQGAGPGSRAAPQRPAAGLACLNGGQLGPHRLLAVSHCLPDVVLREVHGCLAQGECGGRQRHRDVALPRLGQHLEEAGVGPDGQQLLAPAGGMGRREQTSLGVWEGACLDGRGAQPLCQPAPL